MHSENKKPLKSGRCKKTALRRWEVIYPVVIDSKISYHSFMNNAHRRTLQAIFSRPVPTTLEWRRIEHLFAALGFKKHGIRADFHRPHPSKEAKPYQVRAARKYLELLGIQP